MFLRGSTLYLSYKAPSYNYWIMTMNIGVTPSFTTPTFRNTVGSYYSYWTIFHIVPHPHPSYPYYFGVAGLWYFPSTGRYYPFLCRFRDNGVDD